MPGRRVLKKRRPGCLAAIILIFGLLIWVSVEFFLSNYVPRTEYVTVTGPRLPEAFDGLRILHLSDLHEKKFGGDNNTLIRMAKDAKPDLIAITGDMLQSYGGLSYVGELLPLLCAVAPVYYVTGNHEWACDGQPPPGGGERLMPRLRAIFKDYGALWLDSSFVPLEKDGEYILLAGLCDPNGPRDQPDAERLMQKITAAHDDKPFTLLLSHRYNKTREYAAAGFDVVLSGHAHGGVVRLPFTDGLIGVDMDLFPKGTNGVVEAGDTSVVVSRGLGDTYFPRFLNRPQVLVVTLRRGQK